jgi:hypothetical protein
LPFLQSSAKSWRDVLPVHPAAEIAVNGARAIMASRLEPADGLDFFPTPPWATRSLMERVLPDLGAVPCGGGEAQWVNVSTFDEKVIEQADKFIKDARCYVEGSTKLDEWAGQDGTKRHGLCMRWHCRIAEIGRNKAPKRADDRPKAAAPPPLRQPNDGHDDQIPF